MAAVLRALLALIHSGIEIHSCVVQRWMTICLIDFHVLKGHKKINCRCFGRERPSLGGIRPYIFFDLRLPKGQRGARACGLPRQPDLHPFLSWATVCGKACVPFNFALCVYIFFVSGSFPLLSSPIIPSCLQQGPSLLSRSSDPHSAMLTTTNVNRGVWLLDSMSSVHCSQSEVLSLLSITDYKAR